MKESGLRIRVEPSLRKHFIEACKKKDMTASQVIRAFMREYIDQHAIGHQINLFGNK